jgi:predicted phosphodiesterase
MNVFAVSDVHVDYDENRRWLESLSKEDYRHDLLILAGDVADDCRLIAFAFRILVTRFRKVLFVPGNHDLWVSPGQPCTTSFEKFAEISAIASSEGVSIEPHDEAEVSIVPLYAWYDFSFARPTADLQARWRDFRECRWPDGVSPSAVTDYFLGLNEPALHRCRKTLISFSHFVPRIEVMPPNVPPKHRALYPVLGSIRLGEQVRRLESVIHVYGHSHVNREVVLEGTTYINNAYGYPGETAFTAKRLRLVFSA